MIKAVVSGSFRKHMPAIEDAVETLRGRAVEVLSPSDPTIVDRRGTFLFVASDKVRSIRLVQDRHMEAIRIADFLWLVCPDGYVGQSASMELGFAAATGTPVFSAGRPDDLTLSRYVHRVNNLDTAIGVVNTLRSDPEMAIPFALDPLESILKAQRGLEGIATLLAKDAQRIDDSVEAQIAHLAVEIKKVLPRTRNRMASDYATRNTVNNQAIPEQGQFPPRTRLFSTLDGRNRIAKGTK